MGFSSGKTKTTQNQKQSATTTPIAPDWLTEGAHDYADRVGALGEMDPSSFVAGPAPLQQQAWDNASQLGNWMPQASTASNLALLAGTSGANLAGVPQVAQGPANVAPTGKADPSRVTETSGFLPRSQQLFSGQGYTPAPSDPGYAMARPEQPIGTPPSAPQNPAITGASQMPAYSNPYDQQVINTTLANYDQNAGQSRAALEAAGARSGAFGGSRFGLAEGQFDASTALGRAQTEAGLRQQGFNTAAGYGMQDAASGNTMNMFNAGQRDNAANRALSAAGLLGQQANDYGASERADLGTMSALGDQQRGIEQAYAAAPLAQLQAIGQLNGMTPYDILVGRQVDGTMSGTNTTTSSPSLFSQLLQLGQLAATVIPGAGGKPG